MCYFVEALIRKQLKVCPHDNLQCWHDTCAHALAAGLIQLQPALREMNLYTVNICALCTFLDELHTACTCMYIHLLSAPWARIKQAPMSACSQAEGPLPEQSFHFARLVQILKLCRMLWRNPPSFIKLFKLISVMYPLRLQAAHFPLHAADAFRALGVRYSGFGDESVKKVSRGRCQCRS